MRSSSHRPRKRFGQHFLHDPRVLARIVDALSLQPSDFVVEIGPGEGALTRRLLEKTRHVETIEIDRDLAARLRQENIKVHEADALEFDYSGFPPGARIVGNLPYNISTPLLFHLARFAQRVRDMHFMLQREVVERMVAAPSTAQYGRLSVALQVRFRMQKLFTVAAGAFRPPPKVESAMVRLVPMEGAALREAEAAVFDQILRRAFSARRKTLSNALALALGPEDYGALQIERGLRPEALSPAHYLRIARYLSGKGEGR